MRFLLFFCLYYLAIFGFDAHACQYNVEDVCLDLDFKSKISRKNDSSFLLKFKTVDGKSLKLTKVPKVKLWMVMKGGHGHGSDPVKVELTSKGYYVTNVWFLMLGQWDVKVEFRHKAKLLKKNIPVCVRKKVSESRVGTCQ